MAQQEIESTVMYGIAKKFNQEMEALPMHTHSAIVEMIRVGMQHRNLKMQKEDKDKQDAMNERMVALQEQRMQLAQAEAERTEAAKMRAPLQMAERLEKDMDNALARGDAGHALELGEQAKEIYQEVAAAQ